MAALPMISLHSGHLDVLIAPPQSPIVSVKPSHCTDARDVKHNSNMAFTNNSPITVYSNSNAIIK